VSQTITSPPTPHPDPLPEGEGERPRARALITAIKWLVCAIVVAYVAYALANHIQRIDWQAVHFNLPYALVAGACIVLVTLSQIVAYRLLLAAYGSAPSWAQAATLSWLPALGKYVPGKIAAVTGTVYLLRRFKISAPVALSVALMGDALAVLTGLIVAAPMLRLPEIRDKLPGSWVWCAIVIAAALVCLWPPVFAALVNIVLKKLKRPPLTIVPRLGYYSLPILAAATQWIFWGLALWCTARSLTIISIAHLPAIICMIALANTVGYLMIFAPGGIGVREGILLSALLPIVGNVAAVVVLMLRLIQTIVEIVLAGFAIWILKKNNMPTEAGTAGGN
jgi:hypothetical protein